jgi:hydrogenase-1 operon protein HyaF
MSAPPSAGPGIRLGDIGIRIAPSGAAAAPGTSYEAATRARTKAPAGGLGSSLTALVFELTQMMERLAATGKPDSIDLRSLPMTPAERTRLQALLGTGEVRATLGAGGVSTFIETRYAGLWWVEHRDPAGEVIAELFEVTPVPQILASSLSEVGAGARELRSALRAALPTPTPPMALTSPSLPTPSVPSMPHGPHDIRERGDDIKA